MQAGSWVGVYNFMTNLFFERASCQYVGGDCACRNYHEFLRNAMPGSISRMHRPMSRRVHVPFDVPFLSPRVRVRLVFPVIG